MARRPVHIHVHTQDAGDWDESKHPRKDDGKFGSGSSQEARRQEMGVRQGQSSSREERRAAINSGAMKVTIPPNEKRAASPDEDESQMKESPIKRFRELGDQLAQEGKWAEAAEHYEAALKELRAKFPNPAPHSVKHLADGIGRFKRAAAREGEREMGESARTLHEREAVLKRELDMDLKTARSEGEKIQLRKKYDADLAELQRAYLD